MMRATPALVVAAALALSACGSSNDNTSSTSSSTAAAANSCDKANLSLVKSGQLTVATDKPAYPPYFEDNKPENGKGFESAVAYAIAAKLGFDRSEVKWVVEPFNSSYAPGPKKFDFDVNQISINAARSKRVAGGRRAEGIERGRHHVAVGSRRQEDRRADRHHEPRRRELRGAPVAAAAGVQRLQRRRTGAQAESRRRRRGRPADGLLHHRGPGARLEDRRPVRCAGR
jgi:hypothetical protein